MPGAGTKPVTTTNKPPARCLDITRLIRRAGRVMTGVDRVELAYLRRLMQEPEPFFALARTRIGYVLLDRHGAADICVRVKSDTWGPLDGLGRLSPHLPETPRRAESDLRRVALARCLPIRLSGMLARYLPEGTVYFNTGHSNFTNRVIGAWRRVKCARIAVLLHDTIPLDFPQYQRPETEHAFRKFVARVSRSADLVIYNSEQSRQDGERHMSDMGRTPAGLVAHLGVDRVPPAPRDVPHGLLPDAPYFVTVGTIEPRKNHALLLDVWESLLADQANPPHLLICGGRGWNNEAVFSRLDARTTWRGRVHECPGLSDGAVMQVLLNSQGLLFPSFAEGFGLPPAEAAMAGVPIICSDLPVFREFLDDIPIYLSASDPYSWSNKIKQLTEQRPPRRAYEAPGWDEHFNLVLNRV